MNIIISAKNFDLNDAHREYISEKIEHLSHYDSSITKARVECDADKKERQGEKFRVEVWLDGKSHVKAGVQAADLYSAIDLVTPKLKRLVIKEKERKAN